MIKSEES